VNGIGDGMWVWYGRDFARSTALKGRSTRRAALVYKEALSLMIAQRRPAYYLGAGDKDLETLTNSHLRVLAQAGVITPQLRDAALASVNCSRPRFRRRAAARQHLRVAQGLQRVRNHLASLLGDRACTTSTASTCRRVARSTRRRSRPSRACASCATEAAKAAGLTGKGMLGNGDPAKVVYSFTLMERGDKVNYLRVQTDNYDQPLDINEGAKLDLGSTAKLRTLVTYLDIVDQLHQRYGRWTRRANCAKATHRSEGPLSAVGDRILPGAAGNADRGLTPMLNAAMERKYSAIRAKASSPAAACTLRQLQQAR
jgi:membrane peptidoglycan carboxypeptidase